MSPTIPRPLWDALLAATDRLSAARAAHAAADAALKAASEEWNAAEAAINDAENGISAALREYPGASVHPGARGADLDQRDAGGVVLAMSDGTSRPVEVVGDPAPTPEPEGEPVLILALRKLGPAANALVWWRHAGAGYTTRLNDAGRYNRAEADRLASAAANIFVPESVALAAADTIPASVVHLRLLGVPDDLAAMALRGEVI